MLHGKTGLPDLTCACVCQSTQPGRQNKSAYRVNNYQ